MLGEKQHHEDLQSLLPGIKGAVWVDRPIDPEDLSDIIEKTKAQDQEKQSEDKQKRILIVDDDPSYAKMVREWIRDQYRVDIVTAGGPAINFLKKRKGEEQVDLILLDYEMPILDGPKVLEMLRNEPEIKDIPVLFLTGIGTKDAVERVMTLKPDGYILKSTTREDLLGYLDKKLY